MKWGVVTTMIAFVITLKDRAAEVLLVASFLVGLLLKAPFFKRSSSAEGPAWTNRFVPHLCIKVLSKDGANRLVGDIAYFELASGSRPRCFSIGSMLGLAPRHFS